ncbi:hypothetical protein GCM10009790_04550 [Georgenia ruanii]
MGEALLGGREEVAAVDGVHRRGDARGGGVLGCAVGHAAMVVPDQVHGAPGTARAGAPGRPGAAAGPRAGLATDDRMAACD